ncbi:chromosomal replication initiation protein DnaA [Oligella sp. HMSC05A10]|uniref:chromosomal replication initiator protein DnaA n=1 Tax=Oligella TaxID=90243 RepID=UPI0008A2C3DD|nr:MULTISPECIES: chromosomal replication initiator protein DnaA [Oligella]MDK6203413.1 chromosomal replication initiator protein DnaA [Oligella urethralis]OFS83221.1 chromosomal replication initiation protein DnaA [Oligella sp. HMSC05A10]
MSDFWSHCFSVLAQEYPVEQVNAWIEPLDFESFDEASGVLTLSAPNPIKQKWARDSYAARIKAIAEAWYERSDIQVDILLAGARAARPATRAPAPTPSAATIAVESATEAVAESTGKSTKLLEAVELARQAAALAQAKKQQAAASADRASESAPDLSEVIGALKELYPEAEGDSATDDDITMPAVRIESLDEDALVAELNYQDAYEKTNLLKELSFDTLVEGRSNALVVTAAKKIVDDYSGNELSYNPFYIYGATGLGKTHVMHAMGNAILKKKPGLRIRYIHANEYFTSMVDSIKRKTNDAWQRDYLNLDVLLIDDIQFFSGKERTQLEFFHIFERMVRDNKQIVITSDTYPRQLQDMNPRLTTRFDSGLSVSVEPPELELRVAILHKKAEDHREFRLLDESAFFIAKHVRSNVRELEGALTKVIAYAGFYGNKDLTVEICRGALKDLLSASIGQITIENIQKTVAEYYKIKVSDMQSKRRQRNIVVPRHIAMYLAKELTQKSLNEIADYFGGRDHSTVLSAVNKISKERMSDQELNHHLRVLEQSLKG